MSINRHQKIALNDVTEYGMCFACGPKNNSGLKLFFRHKDKGVDKFHGLNTLMKKHDMSSSLQIANHYLDTFEDPSKADYFVDSYDDAIALCEAVGVMPQKLFEIVCREIKVSMPTYKEYELMSNSVAIEGLVNEWNRRLLNNSKYPYSQFFRSDFRKDWSERYGWDWHDYKRFAEQFPKWLKIFKAKAKKAESELDDLLTPEVNSKGLK